MTAVLRAQWQVDTLTIEDRDTELGLLGKAELMRDRHITLLTALIMGRPLRARIRKLENSLRHHGDGSITIDTDWTRAIRGGLFSAYTLTLSAERKHELMVLLHASLRHQDGLVPYDSSTGRSPSAHDTSELLRHGWVVVDRNPQIVVLKLRDYAVAVDRANFDRATSYTEVRYA
jgi:hypothetical protein